MKTSSGPRIVHAERLEGGIIITFDDGKCAVYSDSLLQDTYFQADELYEDPPGYKNPSCKPTRTPLSFSARRPLTLIRGGRRRLSSK